MRKYALASKLSIIATKKLNEMGFEIINFPQNTNVDERISHHADLSFFVCDKDIFIAQEMECLVSKLQSTGYNVHVSDAPLGKAYPADVKLNCVSFGKYLMCNVDTVSKAVLKYSIQKGKAVINVNQGYTKCSVIPVADNAIITDDESICKKCVEYGIDVLKVSKGKVLLTGFDYGFIGGTAGVYDNMIAFNGDIFSHPDGKQITDYIKKQGKIPVSLAEYELVDTGSLIFLTED